MRCQRLTFTGEGHVFELVIVDNACLRCRINELVGIPFACCAGTGDERCVNGFEFSLFRLAPQNVEPGVVQFGFGCPLDNNACFGVFYSEAGELHWQRAACAEAGVTQVCGVAVIGIPYQFDIGCGNPCVAFFSIACCRLSIVFCVSIPADE